MKAGLYDDKNNLLYTWFEMRMHGWINTGQFGKHLFGITIPDSNVKKIVLDDKITVLKSNCFLSANYAHEVFISKNVQYIEPCAFNNSKFDNIKVDSINSYFCSENGVLFNKDKTRLVHYPVIKRNNTYKIPDTVEIIFNNAFADNSFIEEIIFGKNVAHLCDRVFYNCTNLNKIIGNESLQTISYYTVFNCGKLKEFYLPKSVKSINANSFGNCNDIILLYNGTKEEFGKIMINSALHNHVIFKENNTLDDLLKMGYNIRDANKIIKKNTIDNEER